MNFQDPLLWIVLFILIAFLLPKTLPFLSKNKAIRKRYDITRGNTFADCQIDFKMISDICREAKTDGEKREAMHLINVFKSEYKDLVGISYQITMLKGYVKKDFSNVITEKQSLN